MFEKTTIGEWVAIVLSIVWAVIATFSESTNESGSYIAGTFIGSFVISLIILYIIYWIITKIFPNSNDWGIIAWFFAIVGIGIVIIIIITIFFAVIAAFIFGMAGSSTTSSYTTEQISYQTIATPSIVSKPTVLNSNVKTGWVQYTNYEDHFSIYRPSDWEVMAFDKTDSSFGFEESGMDISQIMDKVVAIYTPNLKGFIMIYGVDFSGTLFSIFNDPSKTQISNELYNEFVNSLQSGETDDVKISSIERDSNYYLINGNPARRLVLHWQINGEPLNGESYIIAHENSYYVEIYSAMAGSSQADASTASNIMRSFTTTT